MPIRAILFDKDGTLVDFQRTWGPATHSVLTRLSNGDSAVFDRLAAVSRYDAAVSAGRLALLSGEEQYQMGAVAARIRKFNEWQFAERVPWGRLRALQFGAAALSAEDRATIRSALQDAATFDYEVKVNTSEVLPMARRYGFAPDAKSFREMAPEVWPGGKFTPSICVSIKTRPEEANKRVVIPLPL